MRFSPDTVNLTLPYSCLFAGDSLKQKGNFITKICYLFVMGSFFIPKPLQSRPFTYEEALKHGLSLQKLRSLVQAGEINHFGRNIYLEAGLDYSEEDQFQMATRLIGKLSAVCLISALSHYECTDIIPKQTWMMVSANKQTKNKDIRLHRMAHPHWNIGIIQKKGYSITSLERTLIEALAYKTKIGLPVGNQALRNCLESKKVKLKNLAEMATDLGLYKRIKGSLEVFA
jgi:predicted transcriptional regulator of viral defense system